MSFFQFNLPFHGVVKHLIIINVLMFIGTYAILGTEVFDYDRFDYITLGRMRLAAFLPGSEHFEPYQIFTHMFMHGDIMHLLFNMLAIYWFGSMVEMVWGPKRFLFFYFFCGIGAYLVQTATQWWEISRLGIDPTLWNGSSLGASGAVFGILVAFAMNFPNQEIRMLFPPIAMRAKYFVPIIALLELVYG
ncbi:MAG: rhomboid family intramembrane serine protease, partial [Saprospiraceae bacterium]|nr:rhomboid family intramembrane serine protease [Saprospiraceae bacterium]